MEWLDFECQSGNADDSNIAAGRESDHATCPPEFTTDEDLSIWRKIGLCPANQPDHSDLSGNHPPIVRAKKNPNENTSDQNDSNGCEKS